MVGVWIPVLVCLYSWSELAKANDETPTSSPTPPTDGNARAVGLLRGMTMAHHSDALSKGRTQKYTKVIEDLLASSYPREITYGTSDIKNKLAVNIKESSSKKKENDKFAYNFLRTDSLRQNKSSLRNTVKLDQNYKSRFVRPSVKLNSFFASNLEQRLPIKNELANSIKFKNESSYVNFKKCVNNHLECSKNKIILIKHDRLKDKSQAHIVDKRKYMLSVLGVMNGTFNNKSKKSENKLDSLNELAGLTKENNLKVIKKTKLIDNEINIDKLYDDLKTQLIDIKDKDSYPNNYEAYEKKRKIFSNSLVDLKDLDADEDNRKKNDTLIRSRRQNNLQFLTDIDNINNRSKEQHKLCWTETVTITTNIKTNISENSHEIIKEYGVVWERPVGEENLSPVSLGKKINGAKETLSRENMNENYLSLNERELLSNSSKKMVKYKIISSNPNQTVKQIETTYCKTGNRIDIETITNNKLKNQRTKFNILPKEKTTIHSNNDSDIFEPSLESQADLHVKRTRSINLSEAGDTNLKPNKLFEKVRFDHRTFNIPERSQNQDLTIPKKVRDILGSNSILTQWHPTEKAKTTASYETGEDSSYYDGDNEDYDYYSDYTDYFDESHFNKTMNNKINKVENVRQIKNKKGKFSKGSVEDIASIEQSSDEAEEYVRGSLKQTENIDHVILESLTSFKPPQNIISTDYDNHKHVMVLDAQTSPKNENAKSINKTISLESINHKSPEEDYTLKNKTGGIYLETENFTSKIIRETYTKIPIVDGISLRSDLATNDSKISPTIKQINLKSKISTSTPHVTYTEKNLGITLLDLSKNYDSTINSNEKRTSELTTHSKIPQEKSERANIFKKTILPSGRSPDKSTKENTTEQVLIKSNMVFDKVHTISEENSTQQMFELTTEPQTSRLATIKENISINIIPESSMRSYKALDSSTNKNTSLGSDTHEISKITSKMYIDKSHKIPTKNVTEEEIPQSGLYSNTLNEISLNDNVNESINLEQITSFYTINDLISTEIPTKLLSLNKYSNNLNDRSESENVNGLISLESATYLDKSQEALLTENPIEDLLESQTTSDILFDTSTKENILGHISLESDKASDTSYEDLGKSSEVSTSKNKTGNESLEDSSLHLDNGPNFERSNLENELRDNSTHTSSFESKGIDDTYTISNTSDDSNNEISEFGDFSHSSDTNSMGKAADDMVLLQDDIIDISLSTENNPFDTTSEPDTDTYIYDKETYTEKGSTHFPGYQLINSSDEVSYTEKENIHKPGLIEYDNNSENIKENYTAEGLDENISLASATFLDKYLDKKEDSTVNASPKSSTVSKLATVHYNLTSLNDSIIMENTAILKLTTDKPISNTSSSFLESSNLIENTIEPAERSNIENEMLEFTTLNSLPVELALNGTIDSLFLDSTVMIYKNTEKRIGGTIVENTSNLDTLLKINEEPFDENNNTGLFMGLLNDSQDIMKVNTKNNKNESLENAKSTVVVNTANLESKSITQSKLTGTTQEKLFTYNASLESADLLVTTIKSSIENLSFYSSFDYTSSPGNMAESGIETLLKNGSTESVARSETVREPTNKIIDTTKMKVMNEELTTETSPINTYLKFTRLSRPTKKAKNKISFDNLYSELSTLSVQETSPVTNKRPNVKVSFEKIALGTSSLSQNKGESKVENSTQNVLRKFSAPLVMNKHSETETSTINVLSNSTTTLRNNSMPLVEIPTKIELIELDSISKNTNIVTTEIFKGNVSRKPSTSLENTSLKLLETSNSSVSIELLTPSRMTEHSPIEALNVNSALVLSSPLGNSIVPEVEKSTENVSFESSTLLGETSISLKYAVTESLIVQSDKLLGNNSIPSVNKFTENRGRESYTLPGEIGQLVIETSNANISIESSTLSEKISMAAEETSTGNVLFEYTKLSGKSGLKSVEISYSNMSMAPFIHSEMTEQSSNELSNTKAIELSKPLGNSIILPEVEKYSENLSSDHPLLSVNTVMPLVDKLSEDVSINFATLSGNTIISPIETFTENISNDFITLSEYTNMPSVEISNSNMSLESAIPLADTEQSEIYNSNIPFKSSKLLGNSIISKVETVTVNVSLESDTLLVTTIMPSVETFKEFISYDFSKPSETTSTPSVEISNLNMSKKSVNLLIKTGQSEIETSNPNITFNLFTPSEENVRPAVETYTVKVLSGSTISSVNITMPSVKPFTETALVVNSTPFGITEQSPINTSMANLLLESFTLSEKSLITDKKPYDENILLESVTLSGINNKSSLEAFSEIISIDFDTLSESTKFASVETSTKETLLESYNPSDVTVQSAIETSNAIFLFDNFTLSDNSIIHGEETSTRNILLESATSSGITIMPSVEMFTEIKSIESLPLLGNTNMLPRETLIENMSLNSSTISEITNMPQEETFTENIANHYTLSDFSRTPLVETPSTNLSIDSPTLSEISGQSAINTSNGYVALEYSKKEGISISSVNMSKANASSISPTLSRIATETSEETSNMNISLEFTRQSTIPMMPSFEKSSSNVYLEYGTVSGMSEDSPVEISTFGVSLEHATHPRTNKNISLEIPIVNISLETSTSFGLFEKPPRDLSTQNLSLEFVKPTTMTEQTLLETSTVNLPLENTTLFGVLNETSKEKSRLNKSLETVTLIGISGEKGIETTFSKLLEFKKVLGASTDTSLYKSNANLPLKSKEKLKLNTDKLTENVTLEFSKLLGMSREPLKEKSLPTESLELVIGTTKEPSVEIITGNVSLESATHLGMTREPLKEKSIPTVSLELVPVIGTTIEPSVEKITGKVSLEYATLFGMTQEPLKEKSITNESLELDTVIGTTREPSVKIMTEKLSLESATLFGMTQGPLDEKSIPTESLELVTVIGTIKEPSLSIMIGNASLESATIHGTTREPLKEKLISSESLKLVTVMGVTREPSVEITNGNVSLESSSLLGTTQETLKEKSIPTESLEMVTIAGTTREPLVKIMTGNVSLESATLLGTTQETLKEKSISTESLELVTVIGTTKEPSVEIITGNVSFESATLFGMTRGPLKEKSIPNESRELVTITGTTKEPAVKIMTENASLESATHFGMTRELLKEKFVPTKSLELVTELSTTGMPSLDITTGNASLEFSTLLGMTREPLKETSLFKSVDLYTVSEDVKGPLIHVHSVNEPIENLKILSITRVPYVELSSLENNSTMTKSELHTDTLSKTKEISTVENFSLNVSLESATKYEKVKYSVTDTSTINSLLKSDSLPGKTDVSLEEHAGENVPLVNHTLLETTSVYIKEPFIKNISLESVNLSITTRKPKIKTTDKAEFLDYSPLLVVMEKSAIENTTEKISFDYNFLPLSIKETERETTSQNVALKPIALEDKTEISEMESTAQSVSLEFVSQIASKGVSEIIPTTQHAPLEYVPFKTYSGDLQLKPITQILSLESISSTVTTEESEINTTTENVPLKSATLSVTTVNSNIKHTTQNIPFESSTLSVTRGESKTKPYTQNTLWESPTLAITTDVSEIENTTQNVLLELVTLAITTEESEIETTNKHSLLESVPLIVKTVISEIQSTTQDVHFESIPLSNKSEISEIEPATQKSLLKYLPITFTPIISETRHTAQNESLKSFPITYTTEISEIELTTESVSLEFVTSAITTEETEIETTNQDAPLESVPLIVKTGISEIQSTTKELHLESNTLLDNEEISEIEPTTQKSLSLTFTPRVLETEHTAQNESLKSFPITYTTKILEIEPTIRTVPLEAVTFSATTDLSEIEITTETVYLESVTLAITKEESEIETTNKNSILESFPLIVKTEISEIRSTTQDVQFESTTLSDKAETSEIKPTNQESFLKNVTLTQLVSVTEHTAKNESLKSLPITYTAKILKLEPTTQTVPFDLVTLTATTDVSEIDLTTETVSLETVPLIATTGTSELEPTTQTVTLESLPITSMTVVLKGEQNTLAVSIESDPLTVTTEVSKIESISTNVSLEFVSLNAITGISEIEQTTQDESLESFPLSVNTGISAIEPTTQDASWELSTLMATTKESEIETTNQNLYFESDNLPVMTKISDIQPGNQNVDFYSSTLSFKTAGSEIKSNTQNIYLESVSLSATTEESEIKPLSKNVSIESMNLTLPSGESLINFYTQNVYIDAATLSLPTIGSLTEYSTEKLYLGTIKLPQINENVSLENSPLIEYSKYDPKIKMTAISAQEISPANVLLEYNNITNTTEESSLKISIKNVYLESLNLSEKTNDLGIENINLLSENQTKIVEESSVGNYLTNIGSEYVSIYGNTGVEISTVNESLENNNLTVDWLLETSSFSVEALTGESALETSTLNVLWDSSTQLITGDPSVETTILNRALESTTINWKTYSSTGSSNTGESLETTTLTDTTGEPAVDTSIENDSLEYATITEIKEASTVETQPSSDIYWDSTTLPSTTEYSTVDFSSPNVSLESAAFSGKTSVALELEPKFTKNHSLSSNNNSTKNWDLIAETSTKYFSPDSSTSLEIKGSVMNENIPKNLYMQSKTNSELTEEGFTDNTLLDLANLLLSPEKTKFGYTKENYTSRYPPFSYSNNQTTIKYDIVRSKNVHTVTTAKPVLDNVSESFTYPTVNFQEVSKFESLIEHISSNSDKFQSKTSTINPIFDQVSSEYPNIKYSSFQKPSTVEPIYSQVSLRPYIFPAPSKQEIFKVESIDNQILSKMVLKTINSPKTSTKNLKEKQTSLESDSFSIPRQPESYTVESIIDQESLGIVTVAPLQSKEDNTRIPLFNQVLLLNITNAQKIDMKEPASDQLSLESEALSVSKIENITQIDKVTGPTLVYGKLTLPETILEPITLNEPVTLKHSNIQDISKIRLVDGQIPHKPLKILNVSYFENSNAGLLNDTKLRESVANPKTNFKETQTMKSKFKQGYIGSVIFTTTNVESLNELINDGSISPPPKFQDYTAIQPFREPLYLDFDNIFIPKITQKHKTKLVFGSKNLSREGDNHNKNQLIDHEITLNYTNTGENMSDSHVKQSLFDQIMSKWENAQSKEVLKGVSYLDTKKPHVTVPEANNNIITNRSSINKTQNIEINIMSRSRHKVESKDKNEITKLPELIFGLPTIDIDPIYKNTLYSENKYKTFYVPKVKENYTLLLENTSQTLNNVKNLKSSLLDQNFKTDNVMYIYGSTKPASDEVTYTDSGEDYFTTTEFAIDYMLSTESIETSDEFYDSTTEDVSYGYISSEEFTTTEISTHDPESTEINFDESITEENTKNDFTTTEYSTDSEEDSNEIANQRMIGSRYFLHSYKPLSFLNTNLLENSTRNEHLDKIKTKEDERKSDEKGNTEITITELYNRVYEEMSTEEIVTTITGHMSENSNQVDINEDTYVNSEWTTTMNSDLNIWTKKPINIKIRPSDEIIPDVEINYTKNNVEKSRSIEMTTLEIIPAKRKFGEKNIISKITLNNDVNNNKINKEYNGNTEQSSEEETSIENLKYLETGVYEPNLEIGSLKLYLNNSEKYSDTTEDENLVGLEKQINGFKKPKDKSILMENKYETKPSTLKYSEESIIKGGKIQIDFPENIPLAPHLHFNKTKKEINNISQFNKKTSDLNHSDFTIEPLEKSRWIKLKSRFSDYTEPEQSTEAISNKKLSDFGEFRRLHSTNISTSYRLKSSSIFPNTELEYRLTTEKKIDSKYPYSNIDITPNFSKTENIASNLNSSVSFLSIQNNKITKSRKHNIWKEHIPLSLQTEYVNKEINNYETTPMSKSYNTGENKMYSTKEILENIERKNYSKNRPEFLPKQPNVLSLKNSQQSSILLPNQYKIDSNKSSYSRNEYENKTRPVSTTFYESGGVNANTPCTDAKNIHHNIESPTIGTRNAGFNLKLSEIERNPLQERKYTAEGQLETLNSKTNLTLQQLIQIFHSKPDIDKEILRHNNLTNNLTVKQILNILYLKVKETAQHPQKYSENKTKEGNPMFDHSSIPRSKSQISIKQTMQGSKNRSVEIYNDTPRKNLPITELFNCIKKDKNYLEYDYNFDQYDDSSSDKSNQNNREEQIERDILCQVPPEDTNKFERDNQHLKKNSDNTGDDIDISQFFDEDRVLSYDSEYGIYDDERHKEDYRRMADMSNIVGYQVGNQKNMNNYPLIMRDKIKMPRPFDKNLAQVLEDNEQNIGNIDYVSDPTIFYYHTAYKDKNQRFTPYDYARYFEVGPQKYTHDKSSNSKYNRYENRGIKNINIPNNVHSNLETHFGREKYRNNWLRRRPIRRKYQTTTFSKTNMLSQNMKYAPSEEYTKRLPRVTLTKLKRRNPTFIRIPYLLFRNEYLRDTSKSHTHGKNNYYMNMNLSSEKLRNNDTINFHKNFRILKNRRKKKRKQMNGDYSADNVLNLESSILFYPNNETENNSFEYNGRNIGNTQTTYDNVYLNKNHNLKQSVIPYINKELESKSIDYGEPFSEIYNIDYDKNITNNQRNELENVSNYFRNKIDGKSTPSEQPNIAKRQNDDHAELLYERLSSLNPQYSDEVNPNKYTYPDKQSILNHPDTPYTKTNLKMVLPYSSEMSAYVDYENPDTKPHTKFDLSNEKSTHLVKVMKPFFKEEDDSNEFYETQKPIKGKNPQFNTMLSSKEYVLEKNNIPYSKVTKHEPYENHDSSIENSNGKNYMRMLKRVMLPSAQDFINNEYSEYEKPSENTFY